MGRRHFNREFKLEAVKLVKERGVSVSQAARDLGIGASVVGRWVREIQSDKTHAFPGRGQMKPDDAEVARLKRADPRQSRAGYSKKNHWAFRQGPNVRFAAIAKCQHLWPLAWLCKTLEVTRGGFYAWIKRPESERDRVDTQLTAAIRTSFAESDQTYGARRVRRDLRDWGHPCGVHRIERLMRKARLQARPRRRRSPSIRALGLNTRSRPTYSIGSLPLLSRTANGPPTLPTSGRARVGCMSLLCSTCSPVGQLAGR